MRLPSELAESKDNIIFVLDQLQIESKPLSGKETPGN